MRASLPIKRVNVNEIKPYWRNPRKNDDAIEAIASSIREFGYSQPIVVDGDMTIIAGHSRYQALQKLGITGLIPVVVRDDLTSDQCKRFRIIDNKSHELSGWDVDALTAEMREIGFDDALMREFFSEAELEDIFRDLADQTQAQQSAIQGAIDGAQAKLDAGLGNEVRQLQRVVCPHCQGEFMMDINEFSRPK